jgi:hypothetical protein
LMPKLRSAALDKGKRIGQKLSSQIRQRPAAATV